MTRAEIRDQVRMSSLVEDTYVSDAELNDIINNGLHWVDGFYPFPVTIVELSTDGSSPAFAENFHWVLVNWALAKVMEREEYYDVADQQLAQATSGVRRMAQFYTGGRT